LTRHFRPAFFPLIRLKQDNCIVTSEKINLENLFDFPIPQNVDEIITHEKIAHRAYLLWIDEGRPANRDEAIWLQAERELRENLHANRMTPRFLPETTTSKAPSPIRPSRPTPPAPGKSLEKNSFPLPDSDSETANETMEAVFGDVFEEVDFDAIFDQRATGG
jgi:hypothetical protein